MPNGLIPDVNYPGGLPPGWQYQPTNNNANRPWWQNLLSATAQFAVNGLANTLNMANLGNPYSATQVRVNPMVLVVGLFGAYLIFKK